MADQKNVPTETAAETTTPKQPYVAPSLKTHGPVQQVTKAAPSSLPA